MHSRKFLGLLLITCLCIQSANLVKLLEKESELYVLANLLAAVYSGIRLWYPSVLQSTSPIVEAAEQFDAQVCRDQLIIWKKETATIFIAVALTDVEKISRVFLEYASFNFEYLFGAIVGIEGYPVDEQTKVTLAKFKYAATKIFSDAPGLLINWKGILDINKLLKSTFFTVDYTNSPIKSFLKDLTVQEIVNLSVKDSKYLKEVQNAFEAVIGSNPVVDNLVETEFFIGDISRLLVVYNAVECLLSKTNLIPSTDLKFDLRFTAMAFDGVLASDLISDETKQQIRYTFQ